MLDLFVQELAQLAPGSVVLVGHLPAVLEELDVPGDPLVIEGHVIDPKTGAFSVPPGGGVVMAPARKEQRIKTPAGFVLSVELLDEAGAPTGARFVAEGESPDACAAQARLYFRRRAAELAKKRADPAHDADAAALVLGKVEAVAPKG